MFRFTPFGDNQHVICPACEGQAILQGWSLTCTACAYRSNEDATSDIGPTLPSRCEDCGAQSRPKRNAYRARCDRCGGSVWPREPFMKKRNSFHLWAETSTRHGPLWAINPKHLTAMRHYIAGNRQKLYNPETGTRRLPNRDWRSRLPRWMKLARNRREVLRALDRLEARFAERS